MPAPFLIRAATERDIPAIAGLLDALNRFEGIDTTTDETALLQALFGAGREVKLAALVAETAGEVVGTLLYYPGYDTLSANVGYHLADMVVAEAHRRKGIGKGLVSQLARQALAEGKEWVSLTALTQNTIARTFYESLAMQRVDVDFFAIGKRGLERL